MEDKPLSELIEAISTSVAVVRLENGAPGQLMACNQRFCAMLKREAADLEGRALRDVLPRYAWRNLKDPLRSCISTGLPVELVQPLDYDEGAQWWRIVGHLVIKDDGFPAAILLTCLDITARVELENELKVANVRFSAVVQTAYDGIVTIDDRQRIKLFNAAAEEMFGYEADEVIGQPLEILIPQQFRQNHQHQVRQFRDSPIQSRQMFERGGHIAGLRKDGGTFPVEISISKIDVNGAAEYTAVVRDTSEQARLIEQLKEQASTDQLTGLLNRRAFMQRAGQAIAQARRHQQPLSVMMVDIDHFKRVNDRFGHDAGDVVLEAMARAATITFRKSDVFARIGGEEFAALLPVTSEQAALALAERLREAVETARFKIDWKGYDPIPFTISAGVATLHEDDASIDEPIKRADAALYRAKSTGRNRVTRWQGSDHPGPSNDDEPEARQLQSVSSL